MKKYILSAFALFAMLVTSCSNDDINIEAPSTININAAGVIAPFVEYSPGELETFGSSFKLRLRALVYNDKGELVSQTSDFFTNYNVQLKSNIFLSPGTYIVIGISDVVELDGNSIKNEFWLLTGEKKLSEMVITDAGKIGNYARILGVAKNTITVQGSKTNSVDVDLKPAGTLIYTFFYDIDALSAYNVTHYKLMANKASESLNFDSSGNYSISERHEESTSYRIARIEAGTGSTYRYSFILPMKNLKLWFACEMDGETYNFDEVDPGATVDFSEGDEFECDIYLDSDIMKISTLYGFVIDETATTRAQAWEDNWRERIVFNRFNNDETNIKESKSDKSFLDIE